MVTFQPGTWRCEVRDVTAEEARQALTSIEASRRVVLDEVGMPSWYWWALATGWVLLGWVTDLERSWVTATATVAFGALHSIAWQRVMGGRQRTNRLSVRAEVLGRYAPFVVLGALVGLAGVTVLASLAVDADGAQHPVTIASMIVATMIVLGGARLMAAVRRVAARR